MSFEPIDIDCTEHFHNDCIEHFHNDYIDKYRLFGKLSDLGEFFLDECVLGQNEEKIASKKFTVQLRMT